MNKHRQAIEILYKVLNYESYNGPYSKRLVIIESRGTSLVGRNIGPYVSVKIFLKFIDIRKAWKRKGIRNNVTSSNFEI